MTEAPKAFSSEWIDYAHGDVSLQGYLVLPQATRVPGVLVVHEWWGLGDFAVARAERLAELGYAAFALDMYGKGVRPKTPEEAAAAAGIYKGDRALMRARAQAGLNVLAAHPNVDRKRLGAIGFCFGGTTVLELARSGADLAGVVSFHGNLNTPHPEDARQIRAKVLVLHGADDPHVPPGELVAFEEEMRSGGVDWQLVLYGGAVHGFTNPATGDDPSRGVAYDPKADRRSWALMQSFFAREAFA